MKKSLLSFIFILVLAVYVEPSLALFHQAAAAAAAAGQARQSSGQSASLYSGHFGQPTAGQQLANLTSASHYTQPFYYEYDRDPRQWLGGYSASPFGGAAGYGNNGWLSGGFGSAEAIAVCLLVIVGVGVLGFPMLLLLFSLFSTGLGTPATGFNFIPPSSTTTVTGRRKRSTTNEPLSPSLMKRLLEVNSMNDLLALQELNGLSELVMANVKPEIREKAVQYFKQFTQASDKLDYLKKIIQ